MDRGQAAVDVTIPTPAAEMPGYLSRPGGDGRWPGVVVLHDGPGIDEAVRGQADWLAGAGYFQDLSIPILVVPPDLHHGTTVTSQVKIIQIAPTILALLGLNPPGPAGGADQTHPGPAWPALTGRLLRRGRNRPERGIRMLAGSLAAGSPFASALIRSAGLRLVRRDVRSAWRAVSGSPDRGTCLPAGRYRTTVLAGARPGRGVRYASGEPSGAVLRPGIILSWRRSAIWRARSGGSRKLMTGCGPGRRQRRWTG